MEPSSRGRSTLVYIALIAGSAAVTAGTLLLLSSIYTRKWEARETTFRVVDLPPGTVDPAEWGKNYPRQFDSYSAPSIPPARATAAMKPSR